MRRLPLLRMLAEQTKRRIEAERIKAMRTPRPCTNPDCADKRATRDGAFVDDKDSRFFKQFFCNVCLAALKRWKDSREETPWPKANGKK